MYQQYLILCAELLRGKKGSFLFQDEEIFIQSTKNGLWNITAPFMQFEEKIPSKIAECLFSCSLFAFQQSGPQIKIESKQIILHSTSKEPRSFLEFKTFMTNFYFIYQEWRETLRELSRQSPSKFSSKPLFFSYY